MGHVWAAAATFVGSHFLLSSQSIRSPLVRTIGEWAFRGLYSAVAIASFAWLLLAYAGAPETLIWQPPVALKHLSLTIMPVAWLLLVAGYTSRNPTAVVMDRLVPLEPKGILKVTRHPVMWAIGLWGIAHLLANGEGRATILFAAFTVLALGGAWHLDRRKASSIGPAWQGFAQATSNVPLAAVFAGRARLTFGDIGWWRIALALALYGAVLYYHGPLFGKAPLALFSA
jgi:uncharacterized membrane protein